MSGTFNCHSGEAVVGYQDDNYMAGYLVNFVESWPNMKQHLTEAGNRVNEEKSAILIPR